MVPICTTSLTYNNSTFYPHSVFMCFVWISEQTAIISLYSIDWLDLIIETECLLRVTDCIFKYKSRRQTGFSPNTPVFPYQYHSTNAPHESSSPRCYCQKDKRAKTRSVAKAIKFRKPWSIGQTSTVVIFNILLEAHMLPRATSYYLHIPWQ